MLNIQGHSGCILKFITVNNRTYIRKITYEKHYFIRLKKQALKQKEYLRKASDIIVPLIIDENETDSEYYFDMEYYRSLDVFSYIDICNKNEIDIFINRIFSFIEQQIYTSKITNVYKQDIINKLNDILKGLSNNSYKIFFQDYINNLVLNICDTKEIVMPIGECHGDLTLSNILVQNNKIIFIDFLDSFIETPLQDIVKLRQDTKHLWAFNLLEKKYDFTKLKIIMKYLDKKIDKYFQKYDFYNNYYNLFQKINLLRIVPYAQNEQILEYIKCELIKLN